MLFNLDIFSKAQCEILSVHHMVKGCHLGKYWMGIICKCFYIPLTILYLELKTYGFLTNDDVLNPSYYNLSL